MVAPRQCQVCNNAPSKYKCPSCIIPYCSLGCFKKHKEIPCSKPVVPVENLEKEGLQAGEAATSAKPGSYEEKLNTSGEQSGPSAKATRPYYVDDPSEVLQQSQLQAIAASDDIRKSLTNEEIQKLVLLIDSSKNPELELDKAMRIGAFQKFTDEVLSTLTVEAAKLK